MTIRRRGERLAGPDAIEKARSVNLIPRYVRRPGVATVLLPPGLGDIHWVLLKLEGFLRQRGYESADAWIWDLKGPRRSREFVERVGFVRFVDYAELMPNHAAVSELVKSENAITCLDRCWGFDFTIALNGWLEEGKELAPAMDGAAINWDYPIAETEAEREFSARHQDQGPWVLLYFSALAQVFKNWLTFVTPGGVSEMINGLQEMWPDKRFVFVGLPWDSGFAEQVKGDNSECLVGKTCPDEYFALLRGADGAIGFANGNTILTTHFGVPTVMIWSHDRFPHDEFRTNWVRPGSSYAPIEIEDFVPTRIVESLASISETREAACA